MKTFELLTIKAFLTPFTLPFLEVFLYNSTLLFQTLSIVWGLALQGVDESQRVADIEKSLIASDKRIAELCKR